MRRYTLPLAAGVDGAIAWLVAMGQKNVGTSATSRPEPATVTYRNMLYGSAAGSTLVMCAILAAPAMSHA